MKVSTNLLRLLASLGLMLSFVTAADSLGRTYEQLLEAESNYLSCYSHGNVSLTECATKFPEQAALIARIQGHKRNMSIAESACRGGNAQACDQYQKMLKELAELQAQVIKPKHGIPNR